VQIGKEKKKYARIGSREFLRKTGVCGKIGKAGIAPPRGSKHMGSNERQSLKEKAIKQGWQCGL